MLSLYVDADDRFTRDDLAHMCVATLGGKLLDPGMVVRDQVDCAPTHADCDAPTLQIHRRMQTVMCHGGLQALAACSEAEQWYFEKQGWVSSLLYREGGKAADAADAADAPAADAADAASDADHAGGAAAPRTPQWPAADAADAASDADHAGDGPCVPRTPPLATSLPSASTEQDQPSLEQPNRKRGKGNFFRPVFRPEHVVKFLKRNLASCVNMLFWLLRACLLVGHTHDEIDRLSSRIKVALVGHDCSTVTGMLGALSHNTKKSCCILTSDGVGSEAQSEARYREASWGEGRNGSSSSSD